MASIKTIAAKSVSYGGTRDLRNVKYTVIHYTSGKGDTAVAEGNYFKNVNTRSAGAHFFVGQDGDIVKSIELNRAAWAVGGAKYQDCPQTGGGKYYGKVTNYNSVSIELCDNLTKDPSQAQIEGVKEVLKYIRKHCPNAKTIVRHFDVTGKHCPARMMDSKRWNSFLVAIGEKAPTQTMVVTSSDVDSFKVKVIEKELNVREGAGIDHRVVGIIRKGEVYTIVDVKKNWGKLKSNLGWINISDKYVKRV